MEDPIDRIKESLAERRENLLTWLQETPESKKLTHTGPLGPEAAAHELTIIQDSLRKAEDKSLGLCEVCHEHVEASRLEMDYTACVCIEHLTGHERTRLENDLELSQKVQKALLPEEIPRIPGLDIAVFFQPAHIVGGDYFDFFRYKDGSHGFVVADVMGKGMAASLLMASFQASLRIIAPECNRPEEVMERLNHLFRHNIRLIKFVTVFLAQYDEKNRLLRYSNAGHNPPVLVRANGTMAHLGPTGAAIGLVEQATFEGRSVSLQPADRILCYTDGVVELRNAGDVEFGMERIERVLRNANGHNSARIIANVKDELRSFTSTASYTDDTTMLSVVVR
jgi:sigma-B regulation protein RsbU (phosphoserine phosphatase)